MYQITPDLEGADLDAVFSALADPTRRSILVRLTRGDATVTELADPFTMSQPAISKHLRVLERAGLIERRKERRTRPARLSPKPMAAAVEWLEHFSRFWEGSLDQLGDILETMSPTDMPDPSDPQPEGASQ